MHTTDAISENDKKIWISITGYRTLLLLVKLIEQGRTIDELVQILKDDNITSKSVSKDTVRLTINTLKSAGCIILRPSKSNGYKYELIKHPYSLNISQSDFDALMLIRERISNELSWKKVLNLNDLFTKITALTFENSYIESCENGKLLNDIDLKILFELSKPNLKGKKIKVKYLSPENGEEDIDIIVQKIIYENKKLYLSCYILKYKKVSLLKIERIKKILAIDISEKININDYYYVEYELFGNSYKQYEVASYEEIIKKNENSIIIKAKVTNEFCFIQRLLLFGSDFKIISPSFFKEKLINKILEIQKGYQE